MAHNFVPRIMIVESYESNMKSLSSHLTGLALSPQILAATDAETAIPGSREKQPTWSLLIPV